MDMIFVFVLETRCLAKLFQISLHECEGTTLRTYVNFFGDVVFKIWPLYRNIMAFSDTCVNNFSDYGNSLRFGIIVY